MVVDDEGDNNNDDSDNGADAADKDSETENGLCDLLPQTLI